VLTVHICQISNLLIHFSNGQQSPAMYTETLPGGQSLALIIPSVQETMRGTYFCTASYANTELLEAKVAIETYGI
jgi:hypothetical protein